jgi:hypothetical protein
MHFNDESRSDDDKHQRDMEEQIEHDIKHMKTYEEAAENMVKKQVSDNLDDLDDFFK